MQLPGRTAVHAFLHAAGLSKPHTQTSLVEQDALNRHARGRRRAVEIGVFEAANTTRIAQALHPEGVLFGIDPFFTGRLGVSWTKVIARRELKRAGVQRKVQLLEMLSQKAAAELDGDFDFIFIDGDHSLAAIEQDWMDWSGRVSAGGIVALHDTARSAHNSSVESYGSYRYFEAVIRLDPRFELVEQIDSSSILRRLRSA